MQNILKRIKKRLYRSTVVRLEDWLSLKSRVYGGIRLYSGHYRIRNRNAYPQQEEGELIRFLDAMPAGKTFWDVGANIGYFSLYAAQKGMNVIAFEPDQLTCGVLNKNIFLNGLDKQILAIPVALNDNTQVSSFYMRNFLPANAYNTFGRSTNEWGKAFDSAFTQGAFGVKADDLNVSGLFGGKDSALPYVVKIDVDGNELKVIQGAQNVLRQCKYLCVELGYTHPEYQETISLLKELGFEEIDDAQFFSQKRHDNNMRNHYFVNHAATAEPVSFTSV